MTRVPRLRHAGCLLALPLMLLAAASCGGRVDGVGADAAPADAAAATTDTSTARGEDSGTTGSDASAEPIDAAHENAGDAGLTCTNPIHVSIGETLNGSTCGGAMLPTYECGDRTRHPAIYFVVDDPDAAPFHTDPVVAETPSGPAALAVYVYDSCGGRDVACDGTGRLSSANGGVLYAVYRYDIPCGDFGISVLAGQ